jgi:hypothetical protein
MDSTQAPYGDIMALHTDHCFVPTISSLALATSNLFLDVSAHPDPLSISPFDALYWPTANEDHIEITAQSAGWFLSEVRTGALSSPVASIPAVRGLTVLPASPNPFLQLGPNDKQFDGYPDESIAAWHERTGLTR